MRIWTLVNDPYAKQSSLKFEVVPQKCLIKVKPKGMV